MPRKPVLKHSDVVFMYPSDDKCYTAYGVTFAGWGGAHSTDEVRRHRQLGIRCTGTMWCLTAGARRLYESAELRSAVAVDFLGKPVMPPWQFDHVYKGQKTWFGCTNHPIFREHNRQMVRDAMAAGADGLHIDDHSGTGGAANHGGGFCDYCMAAFREYLKAGAKPAELQGAGIARGDLDTFDYRAVIRRHARTREQYLKIRNRIPLSRQFFDFQFDAAAKHVRGLHEVAAEAAGHPVLLSANACIGHPYQHVVLDSLTHVICEVDQYATAGTRKAAGTIAAYNVAARRGVPVAATGFGWDWAFVKQRGGCHDLVRFWIALAYAHGQRFMCPHPQRQWCFDEQQGTHWYAAPVEEYAPVYRFIRRNASCFDGLEAVTPASVTSPRHVRTALRRKGSGGKTVLHVINTDYDTRSRRMRPRKNVRISVPKRLVRTGATSVRLLSYDAKPARADLARKGAAATFVIPDLTCWTLAVLR